MTVVVVVVVVVVGISCPLKWALIVPFLNKGM
jgi:hypothetical protein